MSAILSTILTFIQTAFERVFSFLSDGYDSVCNFFNWVFNWFTSGLYDFAVWAYAGLIEHITLSYVKTMLWALPFAWDVANTIISDLSLPARLAQFWSALPPEVAGLASVLNIPQAILMILSAYVTRFVLRFIPGV